jgi:hypothetical protein
MKNEKLMSLMFVIALTVVSVVMIVWFPEMDLIIFWCLATDIALFA